MLFSTPSPPSRTKAPVSFDVDAVVPWIVSPPSIITWAWKREASVFGNEGMDTGIIAQEVEALGLPGIAKRRGDGTLGVRYDRLIPVLIEAVKELTDKVKSLESNK